MTVLELCVDSVASSLAAQNGGADRVELCSALAEGGLTPSLGLLRAVRAQLAIGVHVIIRPRGGDFVYSDIDYGIMREDVRIAAESGANGVVFGILTSTGLVDVERTRSLVQLARPLSVTFHRAIDLTADPFAALEDVVLTGADRVLTSGGEPNAMLGQQRIRQMVHAAAHRIQIMVGGGVRAENAAALLHATGAREWHTALRRSTDLGGNAITPANRLGLQLGTGQTAEPIRSEEVARLRAMLEGTERLGDCILDTPGTA